MGMISSVVPRFASFRWLSSFVLNNTVGGSFVGFAADLSGALAQWPRK